VIDIDTAILYNKPIENWFQQGVHSRLQSKKLQCFTKHLCKPSYQKIRLLASVPRHFNAYMQVNVASK